MINIDEMERLDEHWQEVMKLAEKYGYILQCYGGTAVLATHKTQLAVEGEENYLKHQRNTFNRNMELNGGMNIEKRPNL